MKTNVEEYEPKGIRTIAQQVGQAERRLDGFRVFGGRWPPPAYLGRSARRTTDVPSAVEGLSSVTEVAVFPNRLELPSDGVATASHRFGFRTCRRDARLTNHRGRVGIVAEQGGQLDPQSPVAQSVGVLLGSPLLIAGKLPCTFGRALLKSRCFRPGEPLIVTHILGDRPANFAGI